MEYLQEKPRNIQTIERYLSVSNRTVYRYLKLYELKQEQVKMYSEEEVIELLQKALTHKDDGQIGSLVTAQGQIRTANFFSWFEQFKNK